MAISKAISTKDQPNELLPRCLLLSLDFLPIRYSLIVIKMLSKKVFSECEKEEDIVAMISARSALLNKTNTAPGVNLTLDMATREYSNYVSTIQNTFMLYQRLDMDIDGVTIQRLVDDIDRISKIFQADVIFYCFRRAPSTTGLILVLFSAAEAEEARKRRDTNTNTNTNTNTKPSDSDVHAMPREDLR
jgi:hypothetical protein